VKVSTRWIRNAFDGPRSFAGKCEDSLSGWLGGTSCAFVKRFENEAKGTIPWRRCLKMAPSSEMYKMDGK
jgi:hypothetical protein